MLQIACAKINVTPNNNGWIGFKAPAVQSEPRDLLYGRLFLLKDDNKSSLIISLDYGGLYCSAHDQWRQELAEAMDIPVNQVILHCVHQHDAPFVNLEAAMLLEPNLDWSWFDEVKANVKNAALALTKKLQRVDRIGWNESRLHGYASNRRVPMSDNTIAVRFSRCSDPAVKHRPCGIIDPMLRTLAFFAEDGSMIASWSFYSTHPQVANEGKRFSADAPGEAMRLLQEREPGAIHSLFNGCFGNVTAGKYTTNDLEENIRVFGKKLADGITRNHQGMELQACESFRWSREVFEFPVRHFSEEDFEKRSQQNPAIAAALKAGEEYGRIHGEEYAVELLQLNDVRLIFVNGELFVEYALFAQSLIPDEKLAVVGNCGDTFYYIGTAEALSNPAGYEVQSFCRVMPEFEDLFKQTLRKMLV